VVPEGDKIDGGPICPFLLHFHDCICLHRYSSIKIPSLDGLHTRLDLLISTVYFRSRLRMRMYTMALLVSPTSDNHKSHTAWSQRPSCGCITPNGLLCVIEFVSVSNDQLWGDQCAPVRLAGSLAFRPCESRLPCARSNAPGLPECEDASAGIMRLKD
jgi:hypothetical protein